MTRTSAAFGVAAALALLWARPAIARTTPERECQAGKNKEVGRYALCRQRAEARLAWAGGPLADQRAIARYDEDVQECASTLAQKWRKLEQRAADEEASCPDAPLLAGQFQAVIDRHGDNIAAALAGGGLHDYVAELSNCESSRSACTSDLSVCDGYRSTCNDRLASCLAGAPGCEADLAECLAEGLPAARVLTTGQTSCYDGGGNVVECLGTGRDGDLQKGLARSYTDNGDGTITDDQTGLMWEKKSYDGGIHDVTIGRAWAEAFSSIGVLNTPPCFAGHCDWRMPNVNELQSLVDYGRWSAGDPGPVIAAAFNADCVPGCTVDGAAGTQECSCTADDLPYWSSTVVAWAPQAAWWVDFDSGRVDAGMFNNTDAMCGWFDPDPSWGLYVRAVRDVTSAAATVTPTPTATMPPPTPTPTSVPAIKPHECQAAKNKAAGKYAFCRQKAEAELAGAGGPMAQQKAIDRYDAAIEKCAARFAEKWAKLERGAVAEGRTCPDLPLTGAQFETVIDDHTGNVATALAGGGLRDYVAELSGCDGGLNGCKGDLTVCGAQWSTCEDNSASCEAGGPGCDGDLARCLAGGIPAARVLRTGRSTCYDSYGNVVACTGSGQDGQLQKGQARSYTDNGDGTITDNQTGLTWEKKSHDGSIHDVNGAYAWQDAFSVFLAALNTPPCFAGHCDWRLPNVNELRSLVDHGRLGPAVAPPFHSDCTGEHCTVDGAGGTQGCSCTATDLPYWSSTDAAVSWASGAGWWVDFNGGSAGAGSISYWAGCYQCPGVLNCWWSGAGPDWPLRVRAVRGGS
jgi:hypothetical protein